MTQLTQLWKTEALAVPLALLNHLCFRNKEPKGLVKPLLALVIQPLALCLWSKVSMTLTNLSYVYVSFLLTLATSIVAYRLSPFHPLARFPGPTMHKITKLWSAWICWKGYQHKVNKKLHDIYGPIVRIGPNELSIIDPDAITPILGTNGLPKGEYYRARCDPTTPPNLLVLQGDTHATRRRLWNRGMNSEALHEYHGIICKRTSQLIQHLGSLTSEPIDLVAWLNYFAVDVMGDMAFGGGFEMLESGQDSNGFLTVMGTFAKYVAVVCHIPWAFLSVRNVPFISRHVVSMRMMGRDRAMTRIQAGAQAKDLWYYLTDEAGLEKQKPTLNDSVADGALAIIAGADTTAAALASLFYLLLTNMTSYKRLQDEIDSVFPEGENPMNVSKYGQLPFLTACINEALRLYPPVPTNGPRQVLPGTGGKMIAGLFIPEGTQVYVPHYARHRNPEYFSPFPDKFIPERWFELESTRSSAFIPFSFGPSNCVGRALAKQEMMIVVCALLQRFEFSFACGFDGKGWPETILDFFVTVRGPLLIQLRSRQPESL